jgi:hypothetical protein
MTMAEERQHPIREASQRRLRDLEEEIRETEQYLGSLKKQLAIAGGANLKYSGMRIKNAIYKFLDDVKSPQTQEAIEAELNAGGVSAGKRQAESQVGKSIDRLIRAGKLRKVGDKIEKV